MLNKFTSYIVKDYKKSPMLFCVENIASIIFFSVIVYLAVNGENPDMRIAFVMWNIGNVLMVVASIKRGSFGLLWLFSAYIFVNSYGLWKIL